MAEWIRTEAAAMDPTVPVTIASMQQRLDAVSERPRFNAILMSLFALAGVLLAASGLYGLVVFLTAQRTQQIGVRVALGATPARIAGLVVKDALRWTAMGVVAGAIGAALTMWAMRGIVPGAGSGAPLLIGAAALWSWSHWLRQCCHLYGRRASTRCRPCASSSPGLAETTPTWIRRERDRIPPLPYTPS